MMDQNSLFFSQIHRPLNKFRVYAQILAIRRYLTSEGMVQYSSPEIIKTEKKISVYFS